MVRHSTARRVVSWAMLAAGTVAVIASLVKGFTEDPREGEGWLGGVVEAVVMGGPLLAVAFGLRSSRRTTARRTAIAAFVFAVLAAFVLVMQLLDANEIASDRVVSGLGVAAYLAAFVTELPAFTAKSADLDARRAAAAGRVHGSSPQREESAP